MWHIFMSAVWHVSGGVKGLSGLMSQYAHESHSEDSDDDDVDTSMYNVELETG